MSAAIPYWQPYGWIALIHSSKDHAYRAQSETTVFVFNPEMQLISATCCKVSKSF